MKSLSSALVCACAAAFLANAAGQPYSQPDQPSPDSGIDSSRLSLRANREARDGNIYRLRDNAVIETAAIRVRADEIDYDADTGKAELRGSVAFRLPKDWHDSGFRCTARRRTGTTGGILGYSGDVDCTDGTVTLKARELHFNLSSREGYVRGDAWLSIKLSR